MNRMSDQLAPSPPTKRSLAGMLVTNVPMNNQPKIRPVLRTSMSSPFASVVRPTPFAVAALERRYAEGSPDGRPRLGRNAGSLASGPDRHLRLTRRRKD